MARAGLPVAHRTAARDRDAEGRDALHGVEHRECRSGEGAVSEIRGAVACFDRRGGRDGVADQHRVGPGNEGEVKQRRMDVDAVGDDRRDQPRIVERRAGQSGVAMVHGSHPVEQMGDHGGTGVGGGACGVVVDGAVTERDDHPPVTRGG